MSSKRKKYKSKNKHSNDNRSRSQQPSASSEVKSDVVDTQETLRGQPEEKNTPEIESSSTSGMETVAMFFNDTNAYIEHFESVLSLSQGDVRVNVVIKSQDNVSTQKVPSNIFLYTGEVWWNIHKNRERDGYYKKVVNIDG